MPFRFNDHDAEKFVLARGLLTAEALAPFRIEASVGDSGTLFDILVAAKVLTPEILAEAERTAAPSATGSAPALRSIASRGTSFIPSPTATPAPGLPRRSTRISFDGPAANSSASFPAAVSASIAAVPPSPIAPHSSGSASAVTVPSVQFKAIATAPPLITGDAAQLL